MNASPLRIAPSRAFWSLSSRVVAKSLIETNRRILLTIWYRFGRKSSRESTNVTRSRRPWKNVSPADLSFLVACASRTAPSTVLTRTAGASVRTPSEVPGSTCASASTGAATDESSMKRWPNALGAEHGAELRELIVGVAADLALEVARAVLRREQVGLAEGEDPLAREAHLVARGGAGPAQPVALVGEVLEEPADVGGPLAPVLRAVRKEDPDVAHAELEQALAHRLPLVRVDRLVLPPAPGVVVPVDADRRVRQVPREEVELVRVEARAAVREPALFEAVEAPEELVALRLVDRLDLVGVLLLKRGLRLRPVEGRQEDRLACAGGAEQATCRSSGGMTELRYGSARLGTSAGARGLTPEPRQRSPERRRAPMRYFSFTSTSICFTLEPPRRVVDDRPQRHAPRLRGRRPGGPVALAGARHRVAHEAPRPVELAPVRVVVDPDRLARRRSAEPRGLHVLVGGARRHDHIDVVGRAVVGVRLCRAASLGLRFRPDARLHEGQAALAERDLLVVQLQREAVEGRVRVGSLVLEDIRLRVAHDEAVRTEHLPVLVDALQWNRQVVQQRRGRLGA